MFDRTDDLGACCVDEFGGVCLPGSTEGVVHHDEIEGLDALLEQVGHTAVRQCVGVQYVLDAHGRTTLARQVRCHGAREQNRLLLFLHHGLDAQRDGRRRTCHDGVDLVVLDPLACQVDADIGLVLVVSLDHFDGLAQNRAAHVFNCQLDGQHTARTASAGVGSRHVHHHADAHDAVAELGLCRDCAKHGGNACNHEGEAGILGDRRERFHAFDSCV